MKRRIGFFLSLLLCVMMIGSMSLTFAEEETEAQASEEISLEDLLGESEGISVEVPLSETGELVMESYDSLEIPSNQVAVQDYEIDSMLNNILSENTVVETVEEGVVEEGDEIIIDFVGVLDGETEPFEGGSASGISVILGSGSFIPGFEEQIAGHEIGETFDIHVTFPEEYTEELAGRDATFTITIHSKTVSQVPELNDEFVQQFSSERLDTQLNTVEELKQYIRDYLYENYLQNAIINQLREKVTVISYPQDLFETMKQYSMDSLTNYVYLYTMQGMGDYTEDMLAQISGYASAEDYTNDEAKSYLNTMMMADHVAQTLDLEVSDEEFSDYISLVLAQNGMTDDYTMDELSEVYGDGWVLINRYNLLLSKELKELESRAVIIEGYMSYQDFMLADIDSSVEMDVYVQQTSNWKDGFISLYAADPDGGYYIDQMLCSEEEAAKLVPGTQIHVEGRKADDAGEIEIVDAVFSIPEDGNTYLAETVDATDMLGTSQLVNFINQKVTFRDLTVVSDDAEASASEDADLYLTVSVEDATYTFLVDADMFGQDSEVYQTVQSLEDGDVIDVTGYLHWHEGPRPVITSVEIQ